jgi:hypothetical protein
MTLSRIANPEEFYDIASAQLLVQPEPKYVYARMYLDALGQSLGVPSEIGVAGRQTGGQGAPYSTLDQQQLELSKTLPQGLFAAKVDFKGAPGHTMRFNRPSFTDTTYTQAAREIKTNQTISVVPVDVGSEQVALTIQRFGGPYDQTNGRIAPYALDNFDAQMGVHNLAQIAGLQLQRDFTKTLDSFWVALADLAANIVYPEGMTADNDATAKGQFPLTYEQINRTSRKMDEASLPTLPDGRRIMVLTPAGRKQIKDDPQFAKYAAFFKEVNPLFPGYFASTPEFHFFWSNTLTKSANTSSVNVHRGHAISPGAFLGGMGQSPMVRSATDDNYGMTPKIIWTGDFALGLADNRFIYSVRYGEDVG